MPQVELGKLAPDVSPSLETIPLSSAPKDPRDIPRYWTVEELRRASLENRFSDSTDSENHQATQALNYPDKFFDALQHVQLSENQLSRLPQLLGRIEEHLPSLWAKQDELIHQISTNIDGLNDALGHLAAASGTNYAAMHVIQGSPGLQQRLVQNPTLLINQLGELSAVSRNEAFNLRLIDSGAFDKDPAGIAKRFAPIVEASAAGPFANYLPRLSTNALGEIARDPERFTPSFAAVREHFGQDDLRNVFELLENPAIEAAFVKDPKSVADGIIKVMHQVEGENPEHPYMITEMVLDAIGSNSAAKMFAQDPARFCRDLEQLGKPEMLLHTMADMIFDEHMQRALEANPERFAKLIREIHESPGNLVEIPQGCSSKFTAFLAQHGFSKSAESYCEGTLSRDAYVAELRQQHRHFMASYIATSPSGTEIGSHLDALHEKPEERERYLHSLSEEQLLGTLCRDPQLFYTSTNHMLMNELQERLHGKSISKLVADYGLNGDLYRNLLFRAASYDRLSGQANSLFKPTELPGVMTTMIAPLSDGAATGAYFYLLGNTVERLRDQRSKALVSQAISNRLHQPTIDETERNALQFLTCAINPATKEVSAEDRAAIQRVYRLRTYDRAQYVENGKLNIVEIFDRDDTGTDHWPDTQTFLERKFGPGHKRTGENGEIIFENARNKVTLYMGNSDEENAAYAAKAVQQNENLILAFRGHSFSLSDNIPPTTFANLNRHVLFFPGSCGSSGDVPNYLLTNPATKLSFISNTSTGRGAVNNEILWGLAASQAPETFATLLNRLEMPIARAGGTIQTISAGTTGQLMYQYVVQRYVKEHPEILTALSSENH